MLKVLLVLWLHDGLNHGWAFLVIAEATKLLELVLGLPPDRDPEVPVADVVDRDGAEGAELDHPVVPEVHEGKVPKSNHPDMEVKP